MNRIPKGLKSRLQASLESLSAKEAAKLFVIYSLEADKKGSDNLAYPPMIELTAALKNRLDKSRGRANEDEAVASFDTFVYLQNICVATQEVVNSVLPAVTLDNFRAMMLLLILLHEDATTEAIRRIRGDVMGIFPNPVSLKDYNWLMDWSKTDALVDLWEAVDEIVCLPKDQTLQLLPDNLKTDLDVNDEKQRRDRLTDHLHDLFVAKLEAGDLVGGMSFQGHEIGVVLVVDGKLPAWAALRSVWRKYVRSRGLQVYDGAAWQSWATDPIDSIGRDGAGLGYEDLWKLAKEFFADCRRRPWGKGLAKDVDPDVLVKTMIQGDSPFLHQSPPDFGLVDWETFAANETDWQDDKPFELWAAATVKSLNLLPADVALNHDFSSSTYFQGRYFPTDDPEDRRMEIARVMKMFDRLDTTRQPFTFDRKPEEGLLSLGQFMGFKFVTSFEETIGKLREAKSHMLGLKQAVETISTRYFDGLPLLLDGEVKYLQKAEDYLETADKTVKTWSDDLPKWPWEIEVEGFRFDDVEPDQWTAKEIIDQILDLARRRGRFTEKEAADILKKVQS